MFRKPAPTRSDVGQPAVLTVSNFPGRTFHGTVIRTANALDPATRTMLVEVDIPNGDGALFPGTYSEVDLSASRSNPPVVLPANAIIFRNDGAQVAIVQADGTIHLQKVVVGRDYGDRVEILQDLGEGATIVAAPGDAAREGVKIIPVNCTVAKSRRNTRGTRSTKESSCAFCASCVPSPFHSIGANIAPMVWIIALLTLALQSNARQPVIVALGDSMTAGYGVAPESSYPAQLEKQLRTRGLNYRVINLGVTGSTTTQALSRMNRALSAQPDIVIIQLGGNDISQGIPRDVSRQNLRTMIERFDQAAHVSFWLADDFPTLTISQKSSRCL